MNHIYTADFYFCFYIFNFEDALLFLRLVTSPLRDPCELVHRVTWKNAPPLSFPRRLPGHPSTSLCSFVQAIFPWQEVTSTGPDQKYVAGRDVWDVQDRCFVREDAFRAPAVRSDAH